MHNETVTKYIYIAKFCGKTIEQMFECVAFMLDKLRLLCVFCGLNAESYFCQWLKLRKPPTISFLLFLSLSCSLGNSWG